MARFLRGNDNFFRQPFLLLENGLTCQKLRKTALGNPLSAVYCSVRRQKLIPCIYFHFKLTLHEKEKMALDIFQRQTVSMRKVNS